MHDQEREHQENILTTAAKAVGKAAGKIAHIAGVEAEAPAPQQAKTKVPKLEKKNKHRLPRKEKKALAKKKAA